MEACVAAEPVELLRYQEHHQNFHNRIMFISGHDRLKKISASIHNQVSRFSYKSLQNIEHLKSSVRYHRQIITAVIARDKVSACRLMKEHVLEALDVLRTMPELQKKEPDS
jgi:DNA-binding GntR family transcriptional regulator